MGHADLVDLLIQAGTDVESLRMSVKQTPLMCACEYGHVTIVERLLLAGADINRQTEECSSALIVACHYGQGDVVDILIRKYIITSSDAFVHYILLCLSENTNSILPIHELYSAK